MIRPCHDLALIRPRPDVHAAVMGYSETAVFDAHGHPLHVGSPIMYRVNGKRDRFALGEIIGLGPGTPYGSGSDRPDVAIGGIVGFDLGQVGHLLPDKTCTLPFKQLLCEAKGEDLRPLSSWVLTEQDDVAMGRFIFGDGSGLIVPGRTLADGIGAGDSRKTRVSLLAERVCAVGRGQFVKKAFIETGCKPRDIACFRSNGVVHCSWPGRRRLSFVQWSDIELVIDG